MLPSIRTIIARRALMAGTILTLGVAGTAGTVAFTRASSGGSGTTAAAPSSTSPRAAKKVHAPAARLALTRLIALDAKDTGLTTAQVRADLGNGQTLAQIAGPKAAQVKADALAVIKARLDKAVAAKKITQARADTVLAKAGTLLDKAMGKDLSKLIKAQDARRAANAAKHPGPKHHAAGSPAAPTPTPTAGGNV